MAWSSIDYRFESSSPEAGAWTVARVRVTEALNEPYVVTLDLRGPEGRDPTLLLGHDAKLTIERLPLMHPVCGIVHRVTQGASVAWEVSAQVEMVPALWALEQRKDSRIFQERTVPQILEEVLGQGLGVYGRTIRPVLRRTYPRREYCLQYDETDLAFASRLMAEEGIGYCFDHEGDAEVLVLFDDNSYFEEIETLDGGPVPFDLRTGHREDTEHVSELMRRSTQKSTSVLVRDFDWTQPQTPVEHRADGVDELGRDRELYEHRDELTIWDYSSGPRRYQQHDMSDQARLRRELAVRDATVLTGVGRVVGLTPGRRFTILGHPEPDLDGELYVTRVVHSSDAVPGDTGEGGDRADPYYNRFDTRPIEAPWRPARNHRRPRIESIQTAIVVGPAGPDKIFTDEHGRIKVQFHWDRRGEWNERSSCWIRVAQTWAGPGWGSVWLPRIGMEVLVTFVEGNPDRPLVTGCVYDGDNQPPYALPEDKNKSTIKSSSNPGGAGFNELRFDDSAGAEEIWIHAQKDFNEMVLHDHSTTVLNNQANSVVVHQVESVGGTQTMTVTGDRTKTLLSNETRAISLDRSTSIGGSDALTITGSQKIVISGGGDNGVADPPSAPGAQLSITGEYNVDVTQKVHVVVGGTTTITADPTSITMNAPAKIELVVGATKITMTPSAITMSSANIVATSTQGTELKLDANAKVSRGETNLVHLDGTAKVQADGGASATYDANATIAGAVATVDGGGATVVLQSGNATMASGAGGQVALDGDATVTGGKVDLNP